MKSYEKEKYKGINDEIIKVLSISPKSKYELSRELEVPYYVIIKRIKRLIKEKKVISKKEIGKTNKPIIVYELKNNLLDKLIKENKKALEYLERR